MSLDSFNLRTYLPFIGKFIVAGVVFGAVGVVLVQNRRPTKFYLTEFVARFEQDRVTSGDPVAVEEELKDLIFSPDNLELTFKRLAESANTSIDKIAPRLDEGFGSFDAFQLENPHLAFEVSSNIKYIHLKLKLSSKFDGNVFFPNLLIKELNKQIEFYNKERMQARLNTLSSISRELKSLVNGNVLEGLSAEQALVLIEKSQELYYEIGAKVQKASDHGNPQSSVNYISSGDLGGGIIYPLLNNINVTYIFPIIESLSGMKKSSQMASDQITAYEEKLKSIIQLQSTINSAIDSENSFSRNFSDKVSTSIASKLFSEKTIAALPLMIPISVDTMMLRSFEKPVKNYFNLYSVFFIMLLGAFILGNLVFFRNQIFLRISRK